MSWEVDFVEVFEAFVLVCVAFLSVPFASVELLVCFVSLVLFCVWVSFF